LARSRSDGGGAVRLAGVGKTYAGNTVPSLQPIDLTIEEGCFFSILGPSGCGKTTLLRILAGFEYPSEGRVFIGNRDVTALSPRHRDIAMVFQDYALYPHMTVANNIGFNLRNQGLPRDEIRRRVGEVATKLAIESLLGKRPGQLSGGERQRVALGRAIVRRPRVFLMDEPLSNLDLKLREAMRIELGRLHQEIGVTSVYVTHDQSEAMTLSARLAVMRGGVIQQVGPPDEVYGRPANVFVARFIGSPSMNILRMRRDGSQLRAVDDPESSLMLPGETSLADGAEALVGVRPHDFRVVPAGGETGVHAAATLTEHFGRHGMVVCQPRTGTAIIPDEVAIQVETPAGVVFDAGQPIRLGADPAAIRLFTLDGQAIPLRRY
jgi:ABC-type sugar transport system ATPase subunit